MTRANKALSVSLVALLGLWGCARPAGYSSQMERLKSLEVKCGKLEEDYRAVASARDQLRKRVAAIEEDRARDHDAARMLAKERDDLKQQFEARTGERDALQVRCDRLRKGIESIIGQDNALAPAPSPPSTTAPGTTTAPSTSTSGVPVTSSGPALGSPRKS
jgi:septal ring factor EnvC (AmiA/AmiB activator)